MKWPKRLIVTGVAMLTAAAALTLTACSKNSDSSNDGKVTIEYFNQKTEMVDTLKEIIKDFEKENPKIHVKMTSVPSAGTVLKTRMLAGDAQMSLTFTLRTLILKSGQKQVTLRI